ncbi:MAG: metabolite traffic protein EboE [Verrucomicrobiota bacterium]
MARSPDPFLGYCTNIHPAETWPETFEVLETKVLEVRDRVGWRGEYPIGLRLSAEAAEGLERPDELARLRDWLAAEKARVFTINGFPYGRFHGMRVKEQVYAPDWSDPRRLDYTLRLFRILSALLPEGAEGSVSTLPGSFKGFLRQDPECGAREGAILRQLRRAGEEVDRLSQKRGQDLHLGLEPEPFGLFENTAETLRFFEQLQWARSASEKERLARCLGVNFDTCHFAVQFEESSTALARLAEAEIRVSKVHLSNALRLDPQSAEAWSRLADFREDTYLHQVIGRDDCGHLRRFPDLPEALAAGPQGDREWRVHFHIPLHRAPERPLFSTIEAASSALAWCQKHPGSCQHFEMETYTFDVLPASLRTRGRVEQVVEEYRWVARNSDFGKRIAKVPE